MEVVLQGLDFLLVSLGQIHLFFRYVSQRLNHLFCVEFVEADFLQLFKCLFGSRFCDFHFFVQFDDFVINGNDTLVKLLLLFSVSVQDLDCVVEQPDMVQLDTLGHGEFTFGCLSLLFFFRFPLHGLVRLVEVVEESSHRTELRLAVRHSAQDARYGFGAPYCEMFTVMVHLALLDGALATHL